MGTLTAAVVTGLASALGGIIGGLALSTLIGGVLGLVLEFMFTGSIQIIDLITSDKFMMFEDIFSLLPYENINFKAIFISIAITAIVTLSAWSFIKCMTAMDSRDTESPAQVIKRIIVTIIILVIFISIFMTKTFISVPDGGVGIAGGIDAYTTPFNWFMTPFKTMIQGIGEKLKDTDTAIKPYISNTFGGYIIACILGYMLIKGCVGAALVLLERLVALVVLMSIGPVAIACNASVSTEEVFKKWGRTFLGTILSIILSLCLIRVFADQMETWINIENGLYENSITLNASEFLSPEQVGKCTQGGGITVTYYKTKSGGLAYSNENKDILTEPEETVDVTWKRGECLNGVKRVDNYGNDFHPSQEQKDFAKQANTYRLLLAIAWITLCAESEKIINQLGFTTTASGKMARDLLQTASGLWRNFQHGMLTGAIAGSSFATNAARGLAQARNMQKAPPLFTQKGSGAGGKTNPIGGAMLGKSLQENAIHKANTKGEESGRRLALAGGELNNAAKINATNNAGLKTSRGIPVQGEATKGEKFMYGEEVGLMRNSFGNSMTASFDKTQADMQTVSSALKGGTSEKLDNNVVSALNNSYLGLDDGVTAVGNARVESVKDNNGNDVNALVFDAYVKGENGMQEKATAIFSPDGNIGNNIDSFDEKISISEGSGVVLINRADSQQEEMMNAVNKGFDNTVEEIQGLTSILDSSDDPDSSMTEDEFDKLEPLDTSGGLEESANVETAGVEENKTAISEVLQQIKNQTDKGFNDDKE